MPDPAERQALPDRWVCRAPNCTCAQNPDPSCGEVIRLRSENERFRIALEGITLWWTGHDTTGGPVETRWRPDIVARAALNDIPLGEAMGLLRAESRGATDEQEAHRG